MILKNKSLLFLILFPVVALGQVEISARDAVFEALENNYQIQIANLQHDINRKNNSWSEAGLFPTVTLNAGQSNTVQDNSNNPFTLMPPQVLMQGINPSSF